jgi:hypothetical protein
VLILLARLVGLDMKLFLHGAQMSLCSSRHLSPWPCLLYMISYHPLLIQWFEKESFPSEIDVFFKNTRARVCHFRSLLGSTCFINPRQSILQEWRSHLIYGPDNMVCSRMLCLVGKKFSREYVSPHSKDVVRVTWGGSGQRYPAYAGTLQHI